MIYLTFVVQFHVHDITQPKVVIDLSSLFNKAISDTRTFRI